MYKDKKIIAKEAFDMPRKVVANMTLEGWETIPHACLTYKADIDKFLEELKSLNATLPPEKKITINTALLRAFAEGIKSAPKVNAFLKFNKWRMHGELIMFEDINVTMPVTLPDGRMVALKIKNIENKNVHEIRDTIAEAMKKGENSNVHEILFTVALKNTLNKLKQGQLFKVAGRLLGAAFGDSRIKRLTGKERREYYSIPEHKRLMPHDMDEGTINVSNLGSIYKNWQGECTLLEVIPPQVVAIGVGAFRKEPRFDDKGKVVAKKILPITIAFDHRPLDFDDIVPFMKRLDEVFADPSIIFNEVK